MSSTSSSARPSAFAPFTVRSFRFQWPADLATSWAFEMEVLILGWYVLVETGSVQLLVLFGALQYLGSLVSPLFGVAGDRVGLRRLLCITRALYAVLAAILMWLAANQALTPTYVLVIAAFAGMMRPSDMMMRHALIAQTLPPAQLLGALGLSRTTFDTARIAGALAGAGAVAAFGMAPAYAVVTALYVLSFGLSLGVARHGGTVTGTGQAAPDGGGDGKAARPLLPATPFKDLQMAFDYVWHKPELLGAMALAFVVNLLAFPSFQGLLPYVAKHVYQVGQTGLGYLVASYAFGGLLGSIVVGANWFPLRAARTMLIAATLWFVVVLLFGHVTSMPIGIGLLVCAGFMQNLSLTPLAAVMLRGTEAAFRSRVMGMRMLAIWGLPLGLLASGPLIAHAGFAAMATLYAILGLALTFAIARYWRSQLWRSGAPANAPM